MVIAIRMAAALAVLLLVGCSTLRGAPKLPFEASQVWDDKGVKNIVTSLASAKDITNADGGTTTCKVIRNDNATKLLAFVDVSYMEFRQTFVFDKQHAEATSDALQLMMTVASTLTNSKGVKENYLAGIALLSGGEVVYDKSYLFDKAAPALVSQMDAARKVRLAEILTRLERLDCDKYSGQVALSEILNYYYTGTVVGAISETQKDAEKKDKEGTDALKALDFEKMGYSLRTTIPYPPNSAHTR